MSYEMLVGLQVVDEAMYTLYREAMAPILRRFGGGFRYDFKIAETLRAETTSPINRVFTIHFRDRQSRDGFFSDPEYRKAKEQFFASSVSDTTILAEYER
jgi:uncharacterized protein (DUF1330 family)